MTEPVSSGLGVALLAGGGSLGSSLISGKMQRGEGRRNRRFQERMSNSAYQRGTADMRAAGINPMLAISQGGASQPSGGAVGITDVEDPVSAYQQQRNAKAVEDNVKAQSKNLDSQNTNLETQNDAIKAGILKTDQDTLTSQSQEAYNKAQEENAKLNNIVLKKTIHTIENPASAVSHARDAAGKVFDELQPPTPDEIIDAIKSVPGRLWNSAKGIYKNIEEQRRQSGQTKGKRR